MLSQQPQLDRMLALYGALHSRFHALIREDRVEELNFLIGYLEDLVSQWDQNFGRKSR